MHPLETYIRELREIRSSGEAVPETSYYGALANLFKNYLDDLYVRFFRVAERRVAEMTGNGIVCFVSSHSWVNDPTYVVLRKHLLASFDHFWVENLHGDRINSEYAPDGRTSETVFAISGSSPGIQQGIVTSLWVKSGKGGARRVLYRGDLDAAKASDRRVQFTREPRRRRLQSTIRIR